ncbi:hypothetical protein CMI37_10695 [Candidatus Pacearchaeota archaeon]|nr:hypothetical protein [Candidatus Pacearchaeota archaeon]
MTGKRRLREAQPEPIRGRLGLGYRQNRRRGRRRGAAALAAGHQLHRRDPPPLTCAACGGDYRGGRFRAPGLGRSAGGWVARRGGAGLQLPRRGGGRGGASVNRGGAGAGRRGGAGGGAPDPPGTFPPAVAGMGKQGGSPRARRRGRRARPAAPRSGRSAQ